MKGMYTQVGGKPLAHSSAVALPPLGVWRATKAPCDLAIHCRPTQGVLCGAGGCQSCLAT